MNNKTLVRNLATLILLALAAKASAVGFESRRFTPYFNMGVSQGAFLPSQGDFFTGANMNMSVGLLSKISENHGIFTLYNLGFAGQAFRFPDTQEFASKTLTHNFNGEYRWQIFSWLRVRPGMAYTINYTRTAAGEVWGEGLYDSKSIGGQLSVDYTFQAFGQDSGITAQYVIRDVKFPNYTDIIREFQGTDANTELAGGLKDQRLTEVGVSAYWGRLFSRLRYNWIDFKNERVVDANGTYGNTKQMDSNTIFSLGFQQRLWIFELAPEASYNQHRSNQNFLLFQSATDPSPVFAGNYYDYNEFRANVPFFLNLTKKWALSTGLDYQFRDYLSRQPRTAANTFDTGTQKNNMFTFSLGIRKKINDVSSLTLSYGSVVATSNNHFERYLPYNYSGQSISLGYQLTY
jgi:hypothetical protein